MQFPLSHNAYTYIILCLPRKLPHTRSSINESQIKPEPFPKYSDMEEAILMDDLDALALEEEVANLERIEDRIDSLIAPHEEKIKQLNEELSDWHGYDYDDHDRRKILIDKLKKSEKKKADFKAFKPEPYFCHLKLIVDGSETQECYIGAHSHDLRDEKGAIVRSWRGPYRETYSSRTKTHFDIEVEGHKRGHDVRLRRRCSIANAELLEVQTELDDVYGVLTGRITDPFLISVLNDKHRDYSLSNIIRTIQENQNAILDRPSNESLIVQGCAGSGKTMILLHRLSCLTFDPKNRFREYVVLTPSDSFNRQIAELCNELDIDAAARLTIEEYYERLVTSLTRTDTVRKDKGLYVAHAPKIALASNTLIPDWSLPDKYLKVIYSDRFYKKVQSAIVAAKKKAISRLQLRKVETALETRGIDLPSLDSDLYELYRILSLAETRITREIAITKEQRSPIAPKADEAALARIQEVRSLIDVRNLERLIEEEVCQLRQEHNISLKGGTYRHELYVKTLLCVMYYGQCKNAGSFICIDEAQDLSPSELRLIRTATGPSVPINLFGDTSQNICLYKGISKWDDVPECVATMRFELNENYRNTLQITEFCNKELRMSMTPIGLRGPDVTRLGLSACIQELLALRASEKGVRCVVIYKQGLTAVRRHLEELLGKEGCFDVVDVRKISAITVEASKGLEFDAAVVVEDKMTHNERYIAFTRALTHLFVSSVNEAASA